MAAAAVVSDSVQSDELLLREDALEKEAQKREKNLNNNRALLEEYKKQEVLFLRNLKIRDAIYKHMLNPAAEAARKDMDACRTLINEGEQSQWKADKKEATRANAAFTSKFVPQYHYDFKKLQPETTALIKIGLAEYKRQRREKYAKKVIQEWKENKSPNYELFREKKKEYQDNHQKAPAYDELLLKLNEKAFAKYTDKFTIKNKEKKDVEYENLNDIPPEDKFRFYKTLLTRSNIRFSKLSQTYISLFIEYLIKQVTLNSLFNSHVKGIQTINREALFLTDNHAFLEKFVPLATFIRYSEAYSRIPHADPPKEKKLRKKREEPPKPEPPPKKVLRPLTTREIVTDTLSHDHYIKKQIGDNCKCELVLDAGEDETSEVFRVKYSSQFLAFCFSLMGEVTYKLGQIFKTQVLTNHTKTINHQDVRLAIEFILIAMNVPETAIREALNLLDSKHEQLRNAAKKHSKKRQEEEVL